MHTELLYLPRSTAGQTQNSTENGKTSAAKKIELKLARCNPFKISG